MVFALKGKGACSLLFSSYLFWSDALQGPCRELRVYGDFVHVRSELEYVEEVEVGGRGIFIFANGLCSGVYTRQCVRGEGRSGAKES